MGTVTYIGPPSPGWRDPDVNDPDDPAAEWADDLGTRVDLPDGSRRVVTVDEAFEVPAEWLDPDDPLGRVWPPTVWTVEGGPKDTRRVGELRSALALRGLSIAGTKPELLERLHAAELADPGGAVSSSAARPARDLGTPDNPGDFPDAPGAAEVVADFPPPPPPDPATTTDPAAPGATTDPQGE